MHNMSEPHLVESNGSQDSSKLAKKKPKHFTEMVLKHLTFHSNT